MYLEEKLVFKGGKRIENLFPKIIYLETDSPINDRFRLILLPINGYLLPNRRIWK
ncbi:hypothetical protein JCM19039_157 [Geomicrobium sp. JCM 19039]|nr:hypothetical protein JCM19039_157 [Geomicrobium sp. JCM 19039]